MAGTLGPIDDRRRRRLVFKLAAVAAGICISLGVSELCIRLFTDQGETLLVKDAVVGQRYRANYAGSKYVPEAGRDIALRFNRFGFRGPDHPISKPSGVRRVAVLGDSFTAAIAVDEPNTMVAQLEQLARRRTGQPWEAFNFGVSGFGTAQSLLTWRAFAQQFEPDLVILCFYNGNDLSDNHARLSTSHRPYFGYDGAGRFGPLPISAGRIRSSRWLAAHSQLYVWQKHQMRKLRDRFRNAAQIIPPGFQILNTDPAEPVPEAWNITRELIHTLAREVYECHAEFVVVSIPAHEQIIDRYWQRLTDTLGDQAWAFDRSHPEHMLGEICAAAEIPFCSLADVFRRGCRERVLHFVADGHWNEAGNRLAAETILDYLDRPHGVLASITSEAHRPK